jgi:hypothetical protein
MAWEFTPIPPRDRRDRIGSTKSAFLDAVQTVIEDLRDYWSLSDRRIHYVLLTEPPLRNVDESETYRGGPGRRHLCHNR